MPLGYENKQVIVYGTGNYGLLTLSALKKKNIDIKYFVDPNSKNWMTKFCGYKVISPAELKNNYQNEPILICLLNFSFLSRQLNKMGISSIYNVKKLLIDLDLNDVNTTWSYERRKVQLDLYLYSVNEKENKENLDLKSLDLVLTEKCSLKCVDCSNLMQYYKKPKDQDHLVLLKTFDKFIAAVNNLKELRIIGGEPFMYKKIDQVINKVKSIKKIDTVVIYTNGTIVPKKETIDSFISKKIFFRISDYGYLSRNIKSLVELLEKNNIKYAVDKFDKWQDCAKIKRYDRSIEITKEIFGNCCVKDCLTLLHGKLYLCPFSANAENLNAIPKNKNEVIDLNDNLKTKIMIKKEIRKLVFEKDYLEACKFCNGRDFNVGNVDVAIQTRAPLEYSEY